MDDKITENNNLNSNNTNLENTSSINITPVSDVNSYSALQSNNVNNNVYTMNDISNMNNGQVDNGNFTMVNKKDINKENIPIVQIPSDTTVDNPNIEPNINIMENIDSGDGSSTVSNNNVDSGVTITPTSGNSNNNNKNSGGKGKTVLLILFFIVLFIFIIFLPNISEIINTGALPFKNNNEIQNGILMCSMKNESDITDTTYEMRFTFKSKKLISSVLDVTVESEDKEVVNNKNIECQGLREITIDGIDVECTLSGSISNTKYNYNYQMIDNNNLTKFTEAGGVYPEHRYKENIYDIESNMKKNGYDCDVRGN